MKKVDGENRKQRLEALIQEQHMKRADSESYNRGQQLKTLIPKLMEKVGTEDFPRKVAGESEEDLYRRVFGEDADKMMQLKPPIPTPEEEVATFDAELESIFASLPHSPKVKTEDEKSFLHKERDKTSKYGTNVTDGFGMLTPSEVNEELDRIADFATCAKISRRQHIRRDCRRGRFLEELIGELESVVNVEIQKREKDNNFDDISKAQLEGAYQAHKSAKRLRRFIGSSEISKEYVQALVEMMKLTLFSVQAQLVKETWQGMKTRLGLDIGKRKPTTSIALYLAVEKMMRDRIKEGISAAHHYILDDLRKYSKGKTYEVDGICSAYHEVDRFYGEVDGRASKPRTKSTIIDYCKRVAAEIEKEKIRDKQILTE